jgi:lysophospholipase L1-like esterase
LRAVPILPSGLYVTAEGEGHLASDTSMSVGGGRHADRSKLTRTSPPTAWAAVALISLLAGGIVAAAFFAGERAALAPFRALTARPAEAETLLAALKAEHRTREDIRKMLELYPGERNVDFLGSISWVPPAVPAPFVGHLARPGWTANAFINRLHFRDRREEYLPKPKGTYRVFITGGSTAYGSGAPSDDATVAAQLERLLNERLERSTKLHFEVINTAYPAWSTTQERILIETRLVDLAPDLIVMFSGNNDVHWAAIEKRDVRNFWSYADRHFFRVLTEAYQDAAGTVLPDVETIDPERPSCQRVASTALSNVSGASHAARLAGARLFFALQPNIFSTRKALSPREVRIWNNQKNRGNHRYWAECYAALRASLRNGRGFQFLDLSEAFGQFPKSAEVFIDSYHFNTAANREVAEKLFAFIEQHLSDSP